MRPVRKTSYSSIFSSLVVAAGCLVSPFSGGTQAAEPIAAEAERDCCHRERNTDL